METFEQIVKRINMQLEHCKDCQDTDGQLQGFIQGLKCAKNIIEREKQPEPSTAEKLLWLAENKEIAIIWRNGEEYEFIFKTLAEAINAVYERAKEV